VYAIIHIPVFSMQLGRQVVLVVVIGADRRKPATWSGEETTQRDTILPPESILKFTQSRRRAETAN
jgi:hypothetical protein